MKRNVMTGTYIRNGESIGNFSFYTNLTTKEKLEFVNSAVDVLVGSNYNYIIRDLIFDFYVVDFFSDIDMSVIGKSDNFIDDAELFLEESNVVDVIKANMEIGLLEELNKGIDLNIEYRTGIHPNPLNEVLSTLLVTLEKKIESFDMNSAMDMAKTFSGMTGDITPESIVKAYMNSDIYKKNLSELEESKKHREDIAKTMDKVINFENKK